ncbi:MAG: aminomethyl-transferring glycine dehydrogenase subunit GcvPA [Desulfobacterales bacterium]|nr:aminomethyl-transferring glycine dehydrogenase subunit GcvPA [Desulfobacterales bacterium]
MRYLPHTDAEIDEMLQAVGASSLRDLFATIPENCCTLTHLDLPEPLTEWELDRHMGRLAASMAVSPGYKVFLGAGSYEHHIPAAAAYVLSRGEFVTAYTPYQPEVSQGTLQAIYEYQTLVTRLLGMDVANASMYDGASALAEALLMAVRMTRRKRVAVSAAVHPLYRKVVETYFRPTGYEVIELPIAEDGRTDLAGISGANELAAVAVQSPNFFGCVEDLHSAAAKVHQDEKTLFIAGFTEPLAYGLYKSPGSQGADISCGEGQSFGIPRSYGGPGLGMFAAKQECLRQMPGRLVGKTTDREGRRGFVLTLATREQHIRREKATSNICSNQGLCATAAAVYMAALGGTGIRQLARLNYDKSEYLKKSLVEAGVSIPFSAPTFNEFTADFGQGFDTIWKALLEKKIVAGFPLSRYYPEMAGRYLLCATETQSKEDIDALVKEVSA